MSREMKDSSIQWIGEIPREWDIKKIKTVAELYNGNSIKDNEKPNYEDDFNAVPYIATKDIDMSTSLSNYLNGMYTKIGDSKFKIASINSTLLCIEGGSAGKKITYLTQNVSFINKLCCFKPCKINPKYLYFYLKSPSLMEEFNNNISGLIGGVSIGKLKNFIITYPPLQTQQYISDYLDDKCTEIDMLIEKIKTTIEEYKQYKQSVITEAVTKGLNPDVEMRDSGIEWIGQVPKHWQVRKVKYLLKPLQREVLLTDGIITCFRNGEVTLRDNKKPDGYTISDTEHGYQGVDIGDLVIHGMDAFAGAIGISDSRGKCTPVVHVCNSKEYKLYYVYLLRCMAFNDVLMSLSEGIRIRSSDYRNWNKLAKIEVQLPPFQEQENISKYLYGKCFEIDKLIEKKQAIVNELESYKKSLIYEYITGKKAVGVVQKAAITFAPIVFIEEVRRLEAQTALMAKALDAGHMKKKFGTTEWYKTLYLLDACVGFPLQSAYIRGEYGPILSTNPTCADEILYQKKWFRQLNQTPRKYVPTISKNEYMAEYNSYFSSVNDIIEELLNKLNPLSMNEVEKIATLYAVWNDFIIAGKDFSDEDIINDVMINWSNRKKNFSKENWKKTLEQMRILDIVPKGYGKNTVKKAVK